MEVAIINGPNLNLLGTREPEIYGSKSFEDYFEELKHFFPDINFRYFQSNHEGDLIDKIQLWGTELEYIVFNPAAFAHYSFAIADAMAAIDAKIVEVHISNVHKREAFRQQAVTASKAWGVITGFGLKSYFLAIEAILHDAQI